MSPDLDLFYQLLDAFDRSALLWSYPGLVDGFGLSAQVCSSPCSVAVVGGLWETRSVFQGVWEGARG